MNTEGEQINIDSAARAMEGLEEFSGIVPEAPAAPAETTPTNEATPPVENTAPPAEENVEATAPPVNEPVVNEGTPEVPTNEPVVENESNEETITNPIFGDTNLAETPTDNSNEGNTEIDSFSDFDSLLKEVGVEDKIGLKTKIEQWQGLEPQLEESQKAVSEIDQALKSLSPELYAAMQANLKGEDWRGILESAPNLDLTKSAEDVETRKLVDTFYPGKFTEDDWEEYNAEDGDPSIKKAVDIVSLTAKDKFEAKKREYSTTVERDMQSRQEKAEKFNSSLQKANEYLKREMPGIDEKYLSQLNTKITKEGITSHFYNEDGTLKETAALSFLQSTKDYEALVQVRINNATKDAKNRERQEVLDRGSSIPNQRTRSNSSTEEMRPEVKSRLDEIDDLMS